MKERLTFRPMNCKTFFFKISDLNHRLELFKRQISYFCQNHHNKNVPKKSDFTHCHHSSH